MWGVFVISVGDDTHVSIISPLLAQVLNITIAKSVASEGSVNIQLKPGSGANISPTMFTQNRFWSRDSSDSRD